MAGEGGQISKTIVEVYVETDSESEPYSSSEGDDCSESTLTATEAALDDGVAFCQQSSEPIGHEETVDVIPHQMSPPAIISSSGVLPSCLSDITIHV